MTWVTSRETPCAVRPSSAVSAAVIQADSPGQIQESLARLPC
jgi:hypothetical protein